MVTDVEKPLLSDYQSQIDEKVQVPEIKQQHSDGTSQFQDKWSQKFQKFDKFAMKIATPISRKVVSFGCNPFVPLSMDEECQKAAKIVKSFSYQSVQSTHEPSDTKAITHETTSQPKATTAAPHIITIPPCVISDAVGLLIFTTGRLGLGGFSASTGSGILITRQDNGEWGTPIQIQTYSLGGGPLAIGTEVTDRVYVLNNKQALDLFKNAQFELGPEVVLAAGTYGGGGGITFSGMFSNNQTAQSNSAQPDGQSQCTGNHHHHQEGAFQGLRKSLAQPVYCYMRSRGLYAGLQAEGSVFIQNPDQKASEGAASVLLGALKDAEDASH